LLFGSGSPLRIWALQREIFWADKGGGIKKKKKEKKTVSNQVGKNKEQIPKNSGWKGGFGPRQKRNEKFKTGVLSFSSARGMEGPKGEPTKTGER